MVLILEETNIANGTHIILMGCDGLIIYTI